LIRIRKARLREIVLPLEEPFHISGGSMVVRRSLIVELEDEHGRVGIGESAPFERPFYSDETVTTADQVLIHDMAVNPISRNAYVAVSRGRNNWDSVWKLPNHVANANVLLRIKPDGSIDEFSIKNVSYARAALPNPVDLNQAHQWMEDVKQRTDAITEVVYHDGHVYVAGLSNEEFSSAMWQMEFPFNGETAWTTLEIFHGAHGKFETKSPVRAFRPYQIDGRSYILAAYLCTPLVTFPLDGLENGQHVKGKTLAELGSGNYPLDIVIAKYDGKEFVVMANSQLPLLTIDAAVIADYNRRDGITVESLTYTEGAPYTARAGAGILQLDSFNDKFLLAFQRMPSGRLDMVTLSIARLAM